MNASRRLVRRVAGAEGEVEEERPVRRRRHVVGEEDLRLVDQILAQVVVVAVRSSGAYCWSGPELGRVLVVLAAEKAVVAVEAALRRPVAERADRAALGRRREVPLAERVGAVAALAQHLGERRRLRADRAPGVVEAGVEVGEIAHADRVVVAPGQQAGPRRRAHRGDVEVGVAQAVRGEAVDRRRADRGAVAAELREAAVVEDDEHDVRRAFPRADGRRPGRPAFVDGDGRFGRIGHCGARALQEVHLEVDVVAAVARLGDVDDGSSGLTNRRRTSAMGALTAMSRLRATSMSAAAMSSVW